MDRKSVADILAALFIKSGQLRRSTDANDNGAVKLGAFTYRTHLECAKVGDLVLVDLQTTSPQQHLYS